MKYINKWTNQQQENKQTNQWVLSEEWFITQLKNEHNEFKKILKDLLSAPVNEEKERN